MRIDKSWRRKCAGLVCTVNDYENLIFAGGFMDRQGSMLGYKNVKSTDADA